MPDRPNHDRRYVIDPEKLETELGWRPAHEFEAGIAETVAWYIENRGWWERIIADKGELGFDWSQFGPAAAR
nr:GDP-mannose 4,6-dehydratase [Nocardia donostiensis]